MQRLLWVAIGVYAVFFSWFSIARAHNFNAGWYDLGIMTQTVWRVGHGFGFTFTNPELGPGGVHGWTAPRTSIHADYVLALLAPLSWFGHTAELLLIVQATVVAVGAWFLYRLARRLLGPWPAWILALVYLFYSPLQFATMFEFHAVTLAVTFFLAAMDALLDRRDRLFWMWLSLALLTKEQAGITLGLLAGAVAWWQHRRRLAGWALAIPWAWAVLQIAIIIPLSRPALPASFAYKFFSEHDDGLAGILSHLLHPSTVAHKLFTSIHLHSAVQLALPLGIIGPLLSPIVFLATPEVLLYWLSDSPNMQTVVLHYHALFIPFLFLSTCFGWAWLRHWAPLRRFVDVGLSILILGGSVLSTYAFSPLTATSEQNRWPIVRWREHLTPQVQRALAMIPGRSSVALTQNLGPLLAERPVVQLLPNGITSVDYIVILARKFDPQLMTNDKRLAEKVMLDRLIPWLDGSPAYRQVYHDDRVYLYQRLGQEDRPLPSWPDGLLGQ